MHRSNSNNVGATHAPRWLLNSSLQTLKLRANGRNNSQHCWELLANNVVSVFNGLYRLYPDFSRGCTAVSTLLGVVSSICTPLPTRTQQLTPNIVGPTMLGVVASVCTWLKVFYSPKLHKSDILVTISPEKWGVLLIFFFFFFFQDELAFLILYRMRPFAV